MDDAFANVLPGRNRIFQRQRCAETSVDFDDHLTGGDGRPKNLLDPIQYRPIAPRHVYPLMRRHVLLGEALTHQIVDTPDSFPEG